MKQFDSLDGQQEVPLRSQLTCRFLAQMSLFFFWKNKKAGLNITYILTYSRRTYLHRVKMESIEIDNGCNPDKHDPVTPSSM